MSRRAKVAILVALAVMALVLVVVLPGSGHHPASTAVVTDPNPAPSTPDHPTAAPSSAAPTSTAPPSTAPPSTVTPTTAASDVPTTVGPGSLPQTTAKPDAADPAFRARLATMWEAITSGQPAVGLPAFFPLGAYIQVKGISDPEHDYDTRLIADYDQDIRSLHARLGPSAGSAQLTGIAVPATAEWIVPGVEYNKGSYWRVYNTVVTYSVDGQSGSFTIASMISWRGQWYVVHLLSIR